jgi:hypothetical protein
LKFSWSIEEVETLKESESLLYALSEVEVGKNPKRDSFEVSNCGVWADFDTEFRMTTEMKKDLNVVNT